MNHIIKTIIAAALCLSITAASNTANAQLSEVLRNSNNNVPAAGSSSIGLVINPVSGVRANSIFQAGDFIGNAIAAQGASPYQMFILADPMISVRYKYKMSSTTAFRASVGFSGANFNYKEYLLDDVMLSTDALSTDLVEDIINFKMAGGGINVGLEFSAGSRNLQFTGGFGIVYSFGGGSMNFTYGNKMDKNNMFPSIMPIIKDSLGGSGTYYDIDLDNARPIKRYNVGMEHAFGVTLDLGLEWFFMQNVSIGATVSMIPLIYAIQPETYTQYEGFSVEDNKTLIFDKKVSSGSNYLLYGTENIGLQISFNYYF